MLLRVLATKSFSDAKRSLILSGFVAAGLITLFLTVGYLLRYSGMADLNAKSPLADYAQKSNVPLLQGVFLVLLAAAAMSSLDSTIHSTGAIWKSLTGSTRAGRYFSALSLCIMVLFAMTFSIVDAQNRHKDFFALCMGSMNYVNAGLIGIFTVFTFFPRLLTFPGVIASLLTGFVVTAASEWAFAAPRPWTQTVIIASCTALAACITMGLLFHTGTKDSQNRLDAP